MKEYLVCGCFFLIFTMLLYALGKAVDIKEESYSVKFINRGNECSVITFEI